MSYVDVAVGLGFFLFFLALVLMLSIQHFSQSPASTQISEYSDTAMQLFAQFFGTSGTPSDWEVSGQAPSQLGLTTTVHKLTITVGEGGIAARVNEPVIADVTFDDACTGSAWNTTARLYDSDMNPVPYQMIDPVACSANLLNMSYISFNANVPLGDTAEYYLFYSNDSSIAAPTYASSSSYSSWTPASGDSWTEGTSSWSVLGGNAAVLHADAATHLIGNYSVSVDGGFDATKLGLTYNPGGVFSGTSEGTYLDMWLYVNDTSSISSVTALMNDGTSNVTYLLPSSNLDPGQWYNLVLNITPSQWTGWSGFNAQSIDYVSIYATNSTPGVNCSLKVDGLHFGPQPLNITTFPEEDQTVISKSKVSALNNLSYGDVLSALGQDYNFRIQIS